MCSLEAREEVQEFEEDLQSVQTHLTAVQASSSHVARHSKLLQERPGLQEAVTQHSAACDSHKAEVPSRFSTAIRLSLYLPFRLYKSYLYFTTPVMIDIGCTLLRT